MHHTTACLIQGLNELGHKLYANYRPENSMSNGICAPFSVHKPDYVEQTQEFKDGAIIIDNTFEWNEHEARIADDLCQRSKKVCVINMSDNVNLEEHAPCITFQGHYNSILPRKGENFPMAFSLSKEIIEYEERAQKFPRNLSVVHNFRPSSKQEVRQSLMLSLLPNLEKYFTINSTISHPDDYPQQLLTHQAVLCYGGTFYTDYRFNEYFASELKERNQWKDFKNELKTSRDAVIFRFDSWRLYEAALFGASPITLNFEKYGLETGANPLPWIEYIPVEFDKTESLVEELTNRLKEDPEFLVKVGQNARRWALENHSPVAIARRFIRKLEEVNIL